MKHAVAHRQSPSSALDGYDFDTASDEVLDECTRRSLSQSTKRQQSARVLTPTDAFRFADLKSQDPAVFAHLLADHFVAREASHAAVASPPAPAKSQQLARPVAGAVTLGSFRSWQFGERCLATYRVLFGRPLWTAPTVLAASPRPRKRKHVTPPASSSSENADGEEQVSALQLEATADGELLSLPTVDELLELPADDAFVLGGKADASAAPLEADDVLADLTIDLDGVLGTDAAIGADSIDLLWDLDASDVDVGVMLTEREEEELHFLTASPNAFAPVSPDDDDMEDI